MHKIESEKYIGCLYFDIPCKSYNFLAVGGRVTWAKAKVQPGIRKCSKVGVVVHNACALNFSGAPGDFELDSQPYGVVRSQAQIECQGVLFCNDDFVNSRRYVINQGAKIYSNVKETIFDYLLI